MQRLYALATLFTLCASLCAGASRTAPPEAAGLALTRYLAQLDRTVPDNADPIEVHIDAALPKLDKHGSLRAIRRDGANGAEFQVLRLEGDATVKQQVIARYLSTEANARRIPASGIAISPANYKFSYAGPVGASGRLFYVFLITPKKKRPGLIEGQLWIDASTGAAVRQTGHLVKSPSVFVRRVDITRQTELRGDGSIVRLTHVDIDTRLIGHARLRIEERPLPRNFEASSDLAATGQDQ